MIWNLCIKRPVLTIVVFVVLAIFGMYGYNNMAVRDNPDVDFPIVSVSVVLPGAEPEVIETEVIEPLSAEINTIEGIKNLTATAGEQVGTITAEFELWRDIDIATQDVRDRVSRARRRLPNDVEEPIVTKMDLNARAIMWVTLVGDERWDEVRLTTYADEVLKERIENLQGVGRVQIGGERRFAARVQIDPERLAALQLTVTDVVNTIQRNNVDIPSGRVESTQREFLIKTHGQFSDPEQLNDLIITYRDNAPVRIADIGTVVPGIENDRTVARFTGQPTVGLGIVRQSNANTVSLAADIRERLEQLSADFPSGLTYSIASDDSEFITEQVRDLIITIFLTATLVTFIVMLFLRSATGTFITALAIPASIFGGLAFMYVFGFSINNLSMLALILAIGIVVDDAIVVLENTYRHIENGQESVPAARVGTTEVAFPSIANTLSLGAVFIPVAFTAGMIGRFFFEFGLTVAATVFASTFTALTLSPMLCSRLLKKPAKRGRIFNASEKAFKAMETVYSFLLGKAFRHRIATILIAVAALALGLLAFMAIPKEFFPPDDRNQFMISFETPQGATLAETDIYARQIEDVLDRHPEISHFFMAVGLSRGGGPGRVNEGIFFVRLTHRTQRDLHQEQIMQQVRDELDRVPEGRAFVLDVSNIGMSGSPIEFVLEGSDLYELARLQDSVIAWLNQQDEYIGVRSNLQMNRPQVDITVNRDKASQMNVSVADISNTMRFLLGEPDISKIQRANQRYDVITEINTRGQMVPHDLSYFYVRTADGSLVSLNNLVNISEGIGPSEIHHRNRIRAATVSASNPPGVPLGVAMDKLEAYLQENLPSHIGYSPTGQAEAAQESFINLTITLIFSVVFIYLVLAAQFESFVLPLSILLTLPLALSGAFGALWVFNMSFGVVAFIGLIMLFGMVTKNAILLIDYTNVLRGRGKELIPAAKEAAKVRFRPVMMTTISTAIGISPIALGFGAGGEARAPMGVAVFWGLLIASGLTLLVIPVTYSIIDQAEQKMKSLIFRK